MTGIRLEGVTKRFGSVTALDDVSLEVEDGEFFAVLIWAAKKGEISTGERNQQLKQSKWDDRHHNG